MLHGLNRFTVHRHTLMTTFVNLSCGEGSLCWQRALLESPGEAT